MNEILPATQSLVFPEFTVRCPSSATARFVAVSLNSDDEINASSMQKIGTPRTDEHFFFSVCLAPLWGDAPKWLMLIEFIEYYILQGAKHISIYKQHIDELTRLVLDNYVKKGIIDVVEVNESTNCLKRHRCRHEMQLQDCVFRHRGKSKWVAMVDLDERINVNDKTLNVKKLRKERETDTMVWFGALEPQRGKIGTIEDGNYGELRFRCRWILRLAEIPNDPETWRKEGAFTPMVLWHNTSHVAPINHTTKSIIQPHKVESMGVHQVLRFASAATVFLVPPEVAVVRHYRNVRGWSYFLKEAESFGSFENTELTSNLVDNLQANVLRKVDLLFPSKGSNA
ncbi:hypothetical protein RB195_018054 [Necator americanus]|uniref:Glycosyltransferase family 92 protein n=1 Tax=Necator americanus TaxID=51031 RepID=A0ABR1C7Z4_NECAM